MDCSTPGFTVHHQLPEPAQMHVHWVRDTIQISHPLLTPSPPAFSLSQHKGLACFKEKCSVQIVNNVWLSSSCPQSFQASGSFPMSQFFSSGGQSVGAAASSSVLPINIQDWSPLGWTDLISLESKGLLSLFKHQIQKHQFFSTQFSFWSNSYIQTWLLEKP